MCSARCTFRESKRLAHRGEIIKTALELFSQKGFHNVSMQEIAQKAEFAVGTLYNFFKDKESLYQALVSEQAEKFHIELNRALDSDEDELVKIKSYIKAKEKVFSENAALIRLYFTETQGAKVNVKAGLDCEMKGNYEHFLHKLAAVFENAIAKNKIKGLLDPYYMAVALDSLTNAFLFLWLENPEQHPFSKNIEAVFNLFLERIKVS
ncbi:TetR/AcrR family transcriptional regulator [bacterium]|nr:TetR/AcrR family transcriptional regulator [bacterium]